MKIIGLNSGALKSKFQGSLKYQRKRPVALRTSAAIIALTVA